MDKIILGKVFLTGIKEKLDFNDYPIFTMGLGKELFTKDVTENKQNENNMNKKQDTKTLKQKYRISFVKEIKYIRSNAFEL